MNTVKIVAFLVLWGVTINLTAQFNDSTFYRVAYTTTGIINKTNDVNSFVLSNTFKFNVDKKDIRINSNNSYIYGQQQHALTNNDFSSSLDFNLYKTIPHFYYWGLASFDKSYSLKINQRYQGGIGGAYNLFDTPDFSLNISDGVLYENNNLKVNDSTSDKYHVFRNSFRVRYRLVLKEVVVFNGTNLLQNALKNDNDYVVSSVNTLGLKLRKWLSLTASLTYNRIQRTQRENLLFTFGLAAETYF